MTITSRDRKECQQILCLWFTNQLIVSGNCGFARDELVTMLSQQVLGRKVIKMTTCERHIPGQHSSDFVFT